MTTPADVYRRVFADGTEGGQVLEDLMGRFYDVRLHEAGKPDATAYNVGRRDAVGFILMKMGQVQDEVIDAR
jgi:hypothetical protein